MPEAAEDGAHGPSSNAGSPLFALHGPGGSLGAVGRRTALTPGSLSTLDARVSAFFTRIDDPDKAPLLLVGCFPFDPLAEDRLYRPMRLADPLALARTSAATVASVRSVRANPDPARFGEAVRAALTAIEADDKGLRKVVLARALDLETVEPIDPMALFARLAGDPDVTRFVVPLPARNGLSCYLVGATPEPLISKRGAHIMSFPLAGSMPRAHPGADRLLMASDKDQREHALVVEAIADILSPHCASLSVPAMPELRATRTMWHLGSRIEGRLKTSEALSSAALAALLHPTPAVGGTPRETAIDLIRAIEPTPRAFYAGAVGWCDAQGDGDWHVSLRCAEIAGNQARIHAGAGIVPGSDPQAELAETQSKFRAMLDALGIDEIAAGASSGALP